MFQKKKKATNWLHNVHYRIKDVSVPYIDMLYVEEYMKVHTQGEIYNR